MRHLHDEAKLHAYHDMADAHAAMRRTMNPRSRMKLREMATNASKTLRDITDIERSDYRNTNIGYRNDYDYDYRRTADDTMDTISKVLPRLMDDAENRRGVPGTGRGRGRVRVRGYTRRADMDDYDYDDVDYRYDYNDAYNVRRRSGRFMDDVTRVAADAAATAARYMSRNDNYYPHHPVMPLDSDRARNDDTNVDDTARHIGPGARR